MRMKGAINIFWFRRDLRIHDNAGFYRALKDKNPVLPIFIFDKNILNDLPRNDSRVNILPLWKYCMISLTTRFINYCRNTILKRYLQILIMNLMLRNVMKE